MLESCATGPPKRTDFAYGSTWRDTPAWTAAREILWILQIAEIFSEDVPQFQSPEIEERLVRKDKARLAIERIVRALTAVGDRYAVLVREQVEGDPDEIERLVAAPMRAVFVRGLESGLFRQDLPADVLLELFGGALVAALKLTQHGQLGLEEASAAAASVFLDGARAR